MKTTRGLMEDLGLTSKNCVVDVMEDARDATFYIGTRVFRDGEETPVDGSEVSLFVVTNPDEVPDDLSNVAYVTGKDIVRLDEHIREWASEAVGVGENLPRSVMVRLLDAIILRAHYGVGFDNPSWEENDMRCKVQEMILNRVAATIETRNAPVSDGVTRAIADPAVLGQFSAEMVDQFGTNPVGYTRLSQFMENDHNCKVLANYFVAGAAKLLAERRVEDKISNFSLSSLDVNEAMMTTDKPLQSVFGTGEGVKA